MTNGYPLLKHVDHKPVNIDLCKTLVNMHNQGMQEGSNKQSLFGFIEVPPSPVRPQYIIDHELKAVVQKKKGSVQPQNYQSQLYEKNKDKWAARKSPPTPPSLPQDNPAL